jgi:Kdo2-lipid IVA lauroyltransferase/acyltransferase
MSSGRGWDRLLLWGLRLFLGALDSLPRTAACHLAEGIADAVYCLDRRHRRIGLTNLRLAFPQASTEELHSILRASYRRQGTHAVELAWLARAKPEDFHHRFSYEPDLGLEHYRKAKACGRGVLFLTAHIHAWELLPAAHAVLGHPLSFVVRPLDRPGLDRWATQLRERFGNRVISKFGSLRLILRELEAGGDVGLLIDQNVQERDGVFAPFFGQPACTAAAPAMLALKTGSPVIAGFLVPGDRPDRYRIRFYPPLEVSRTGDRDRDIYENTARFNQTIESVIREFPDSWLWGHRRFGTQPGGVSIYASPQR